VDRQGRPGRRRCRRGWPPIPQSLKEWIVEHTGDVGNLDEGGFLFITDRIKDMIVGGGENIYLAEIGKALVAHHAVINAAAIGILHNNFGEQPLAFILTDPVDRPTADELLSFLDGRLASCKRPRQFEFVDELNWEGRERRV
jgi:long-chain acyl-CoA synthetase